MWDAVAGTQVSSLEGHSDSIYGVSFSPKNSEIVSASQDGSLRFWDTSSFTEKKKKQIEDVKNDEEDTEEKEEKIEIVSDEEEDDPNSWYNKNAANSSWINCVVFNSKGNRILSAARDGEVSIWDVETGNKALKLKGGHSKSVNSVACNTNDQLIVTASDDCLVILWNKEGVLLEKFNDHTNSVRSVSFHPQDSDSFVTASWDCTVRTWNKRGLQKTFEGHKDWVNHAQYHPNGKLIVSGSHDRSFIIWDASTAQKLNQYFVHQNWIQHVSFNHDGSQLLTSCYDSTIKCFEIKNESDANEIETINRHTKRVNNAKFVPPNSKFIVSVANDNTIIVSNTTSECTRFLTVAPTTSLDISKKGEIVASDSNGNIYFLSLNQF